MSYEIETKEANDDGQSEIVITHNGVVIATQRDGMEPEDRYFHRDLSWVIDELERAYKLGLQDGAAQKAANTDITEQDAKQPEEVAA